MPENQGENAACAFHKHLNYSEIKQLLSLLEDPLVDRQGARGSPELTVKSTGLMHQAVISHHFAEPAVHH